MNSVDLSGLSDEALLGKIEALTETERFSLIDLLVHLGELDQRDACQRRGYSSVFAYLTRRLDYAESDAIRRVRTARAARKYPSILKMLADGELHLVSVAMLAPLLTSENHQWLLRKAARRSTREVEKLVADLSPALAGPRDRIRALPAPPPSPNASMANPSTDVGPCLEPPLSNAFASEGLRSADPGTAPVFNFTASERVQSLFEQAQGLLRHRFPAGKMDEVFGEALERIIEAELPGSTSRRPGTGKPSRRIPHWVKDEVWGRDGGRCAFVATDGTRCGETAWLEWDHIVPFAKGGPSDDPGNIRLPCRAHNQSEARRVFGETP
jgi:hypothetical protein